MKATLLKLVLLAAVFTGCLGASAQNTAAFTRSGNNIEEANCSMVGFTGLMTAGGGVPMASGTGATWFFKTLDLRQPFDIGFVVVMNNMSGSAYQDMVEGSSFTLASLSAPLLGRGEEGMGFEGLGPSLSVAFDLKPDLRQNEPDWPHLTLHANGDISHAAALSGSYNLSRFITTNTPPFFPPLYTLELFCRITWDPAASTLTVYIDGAPVLTLNNNIVATIFGGNPVVRWGFTCAMFGAAATGGGTGPEPLPRSPRVQYYFGKITPDFTSSPRLDTCFGPPIQFMDRSIYDRNDLVNSVNLAKWYWDFGNGVTSTLRQPPPQAYPGPGVYTVRYTVTNQIGCTVDTMKRTIKLGSKPQADFTFSRPCLGDSLRFADASQSSIGSLRDWFWTFEDGWRTSIAQNPVILPPRPGPYPVTLTARSELGCQSDTVRKVIDIRPKPWIDFTWVRDCYGEVSFTGAAAAGQVASWQWDFGDGQQGAGQAPVHPFPKDDTFQTWVVGVSPEGCVSDTVRKPVDVNRIIANAGPDTLIARGQPLQLQAQASSNDISWQPQTGLSDPYIAGPVATLTRDQTYFLRVINPDGCTAEDTVHIRVFDEATVYVPTAFTPNGDGKNDVLRAIAPGIRQLHGFSVFNRWGELVYTTRENGKGWDGVFKGKEAMPGAYVWQADVTDYLGRRKVYKGTVVLIR